MKRKSLFILFFLLFSLFSFIPITKGATAVYVWNTYQINQSTDDAVYYVSSSYSDDDNFLMIKSNLYDTKTGLIYDGINVIANASFVEAYISLYSNDSYTDNKDYWVTIYGLDEDNSSTFADFEDFNSRSLTSGYVNFNLEDLEGLDTWVNSSNIAGILNEIRNEGNWVTGNNMGFMILSVQSSDAYRMCMSYDGNSSYAPKLYVKYRYYIPDEGVSEEEEFVETYKDYDIYVKSGTGDFDFENNTVYNASSTWVSKDFVEWGDGNAIEVGRKLWYSQLLQRFVWFGEVDYWIVYLTSSNGTDGWDRHNVSIGATLLKGMHIKTWLWENSTNCYIHIVFCNEEVGYDLKYYMIEINSDGSFTPVSLSVHNIQTVSSPYWFSQWGLTVDTSGYAWVLYYAVGQSPLKVTKDKYKDGRWSHDTTYPKDAGIVNQGGIIALSNNKVLIVTIDTGDNDFYSIEYDEGWGSITHRDSGSPIYAYMMQLVRFSNDDVLAVYDVNSPRDLKCMRRDSDGTWQSSDLVYDNPATTDRLHFDVTVDENDTVIVFWTPDQNNPVQHYVVYANSTDKGETWSEPYSWIDQTDGSIDENPLTVLEEKDGIIPVGWKFNDAPNVMRIAYLGEAPVGEDHYFIYDSDGDLVASCFTDLDDAEDWIDEYIKDKQYLDLGNTISWMLGLMGLIMMPLGFVLFVSQAQNGDYKNAFLYLMICFLIGMSLFVGWLWG